LTIFCRQEEHDNKITAQHVNRSRLLMFDAISSRQKSSHKFDTETPSIALDGRGRGVPAQDDGVDFSIRRTVLVTKNADGSSG
jgi:hypothetical protein